MQFDLIGAAILDFEVRVGEVRLTFNLELKIRLQKLLNGKLGNSDFAVQMESTI